MRTTVGLVFLFQVSDQAALERWVDWFKGGKAENSTDATKREEKIKKELSVALSQPPAKVQSATFGIESTVSTSSVAQPSLAAHSSFYAPSALGSQKMHDTQQSALHNRSNSIGFIDQNVDPTANTSSFGVNSSWSRYP